MAMLRFVGNARTRLGYSPTNLANCLDASQNSLSILCFFTPALEVLMEFWRRLVCSTKERVDISLFGQDSRKTWLESMLYSKYTWEEVCGTSQVVGASTLPHVEILRSCVSSCCFTAASSLVRGKHWTLATGVRCDVRTVVNTCYQYFNLIRRVTPITVGWYLVVSTNG